MARPRKPGLAYFPLDSNFFENKKVRRITRACGAISATVLVYLLCTIYEDKGYYMKWEDETLAFVADNLGLKVGTVREIVVKAIQVDFFDENMANLFGDNNGVLTSRGIQEQYFEACKRSRRTGVRYDERFMLISLEPYKKILNYGDNEINSEKTIVKSEESQEMLNSLNVVNKLNTPREETIPDECARLFKYYMANGFGEISGITKELIVDDYKFFGYEWCKQAMIIAVQREARNWKYVRGIMKRWNAKFAIDAEPWRRKDYGYVDNDGKRYEYGRYTGSNREISSARTGEIQDGVDWSKDPDEF